MRLVETRELIDRRRRGLHDSTAMLPETRWAVTVDRVAVGAAFLSRPEAWTAGVTEADRLDHLSVRNPEA